MSRQTLRSYNDIGQSLKGASDKFIQDYSALKEELAAAQKSLVPLFGAQPPEGNVTSNASMVYFDTTNSPTNVTMYFNSVVGVDAGWVIVN